MVRTGDIEITVYPYESVISTIKGSKLSVPKIIQKIRKALSNRDVNDIR